MKVAVLGTGGVGASLANGFLALGHEVKMGSRTANNEKAVEWAKGKDNASVGTFADAAAFGDIIVLATLGAATEEIIRSSGVANYSGKVVIDTTNPLDFSKGFPPSLYVGHTDSLGEQIQRWVPEGHVVKAFNIVGNAHMVNPSFDKTPDMFICGNNSDAKKTVTDILTAFKWNTVDLGGIEQSRYLEPMCMVWVGYAIRTGTWNHAFALLKK